MNTLNSVKPGTTLDADIARVCAVVRSVPLAFDLAAYELVERAFAPKFVSDYTCVFGGEPMETTPAELIESWRGLLPGYTASWHCVSDISAKVDGDTANASGFVTAQVWVGEVFWHPRGMYQWQLERVDGRWVITHHKFVINEESGDRSIDKLAAAKAKQSQPD